MPIFNGTAGSDFLIDTPGDDTLNGLAGFDVLSVRGGIDTVDGGADSDFLLVNYGNQTSAVTNSGAASFHTADNLNSVTFTNIEGFNVTTGSGDDVVRTFFRPDAGTDVFVSGNDALTLGTGNDFAAGGDGADTLFGGDGNDRLDGDGAIRGKFGAGRTLGERDFAGNDTLYGEAGDDLLVGGAGDDILDGGIGNDTLYGDGVIFSYGDTSLSGGGDTVTMVDRFGGEGSGNDTLNGGDGDDILEGRLGNDIINGGAGADLARFTVSRDGSDRTDLGAGQDTVEVSVNADSQRSNEIRLTFTSSEVGNGNAQDGGTLAGQDGGLAVRLQSEDYADGLFGDVSRFDDEGVTYVAQGDAVFDVRDLVSGAQRGNQFRTVTLGTSAADTTTGTAAADYINGGAGNDTLNGADGNDFLVGGAGDDVLNGGAGADSFIGGVGADTINGGDGDDLVILDVSNAGADTVNTGSGNDVVNLSGAAQVRLSFTSSEVGNGNDNDSNSMANQDGGLAVRVQAEDGADGLTGSVSRFDDEMVTFVAATGTTLDVRDLVSGVQRGDTFEVATLGSSGDDVITATQTARPYYINSGAGNDTVTGGDANDFLVGGSGDDVLNGGLGNDSFIGGVGIDTINGGGGDDIVIHDISTAGADQVDGGEGLDRVNLAGGAGQIRLTFTSAEVGNGSARDGGTLANQDGGLAVRMQAEDGADGLTGAVARFDDEGVTFVAGPGQTFDVRDLVAGTQRGAAFTTVTLGTSGNDAAFGFAGATAFNGTASADYVNAGAGDDTVNGGDGDDFLVGGLGDDFLNGGDGADTILGGAGNDTIDTIDRPASIFGAAVAPVSDTVDAGAGDDSVTAGRLDILNGGDGVDSLAINFGFDGPNANPAGVTLTLDSTGAGTANDGTTISNFERVNFTLTDNVDVVNTGNVTASLDGGGGNDVLTTGAGDDQIFGGAGDDIINSGAGNDTLSGGAGADVINGGAGDDTLNIDLSQEGSDHVNLGDGSDTVTFGGFGVGNYRVTFTSAEVGNGNALDAGALANQDGDLAVRIQREDADGNLTGDIGRFDDEGIQFLAGTQGITFDVRDLVSGAQRGELFEGVVLGTSGNDTLSFFPPFRAGQAFYYNGGAGNDTVSGGSGNDFLVGGSGDDVLLGGAGSDTLLGGQGNDVFEVTDAGDVVTENAGQGDDIVYSYVNYAIGDNVETLRLVGGAITATGNGQDNLLVGNELANIIIGGAGSDRMLGSLGDDAYEVTDAGDVAFEYAGEGFDTVYSYVDTYQLSDNVEQLRLVGGARLGLGSAGDNTLVGNDGNNILNGNGGNDVLTGSVGSDQFWHLAGDGNDTITDFTVSDSEVVVLSQSQFSNFAAVQSAMTQVGNNVVITSADAQTLTLNNVSIGQLGAGNFAFYTGAVSGPAEPEGKMASPFVMAHEDAGSFSQSYGPGDNGDAFVLSSKDLGPLVSAWDHDMDEAQSIGSAGFAAQHDAAAPMSVDQAAFLPEDIGWSTQTHHDWY